MQNDNFELTPGTFKRVDDSHPLDLYVGRDSVNRSTLFLISSEEPPVMQSSKMIQVTTGLRKDGQWGISFSLADDHCEDIFLHFCNDIIEFSKSIANKSEGAKYISGRYEKWQNMLSKSNGDLLSKSEIKGLVGELVFLKRYLIPLYGEDHSINAWIGPARADQDFICKEKWYEVKSTVSGSESINISSVEQLDSQQKGELVVVYLDKTSESDNNKITLNSIYQNIYDSLQSEDLKRKLSSILLGLGYFNRPEYNFPCFKFEKIERYNVDGLFPCIRRSSLPVSIIDSNYSISISSIRDKQIKE